MLDVVIIELHAVGVEPMGHLVRHDCSWYDVVRACACVSISDAVNIQFIQPARGCPVAISR
jgi:hypothetical protein